MNVVFFDLEEQKPKGFLTLDEAADIWGLPVSSLKREIKTGRLKHVQVLNKTFVSENSIYGLEKRDPIVMFGGLED